MAETIDLPILKVLVTGANGQLGSELRHLALNYPNMQFLFTDYEELDITNKFSVESICTQINPDFIINCAAYTAVDKAEDDEANAYKLNAEAPRNLAESAKKIDAKLIHISTDYVFDGKAFVPYTEDFPTLPNSIYGKTKLAGEQFVLNSGISMVVRTAWLYSIYGKNFAKTIAQKGKESSSLRVVFDQVGSPTWAHDLAKALLAIVLKGKIGFIPEVFHYTNEGVCSWYDFAHEIVKYYGCECKIFPILTSEYPTPAKRPPYSVLSKGKIKSIYGVDIPHWRESLINCLKSLTI